MMLILLPCLFTQIGACFPHVVSCLPARPAAEGHHRSPHHRRQSRTAFTSPSPSLQDLFQQLQFEKPLSFTGNIYFKKKKVFSSPLPHILKEFAIGQTASSFSSPVRQTTNSQGQWESNAVSPDESEHCISNSV